MKRADVPDREVVRAARDFHAFERSPFVDELLETRTGAPLKVCRAALERAVDRGLVECGVSARTGWPTPAGLELLA